MSQCPQAAAELSAASSDVDLGRMCHFSLPNLFRLLTAWQLSPSTRDKESERRAQKPRNFRRGAVLLTPCPTGHRDGQAVCVWQGWGTQVCTPGHLDDQLPLCRNQLAQTWWFKTTETYSLS